jgi:hypothetical protein
MQKRVLPIALALALLGGAFALTTGGAGAQEPIEVVFVATDIDVDPNTKGQASLPFGTDDGVLGVECSGNSPLAGTSQHPSQVMTELGAASTALRIHNNVGAQVSAPVQLNCTFDVLAEEPAAAQQLKAKIRSL